MDKRRDAGCTRAPANKESYGLMGGQPSEDTEDKTRQDFADAIIQEKGPLPGTCFTTDVHHLRTFNVF
jgi:hypothetical protein